MAITNKIKVERAKKAMSQQDLARAVGVSRLTIHFIETGKTTPSLKTALLICKVFNTSIEEVFQLENDDLG